MHTHLSLRPAVAEPVDISSAATLPEHTANSVMALTEPRLQDGAGSQRNAFAIRLQRLWRGHVSRAAQADLFQAIPRTDGATIASEYTQRLSSKTAAAAIPASDPLFYLHAVRGASTIRSELLAIEQDIMQDNSALRPALAVLVDLIQCADWEQISHSMLQHHLGADHPLAGISVKRLLFYARWSGQISIADFETGLNWLALKEFHGGEIQPAYRGKDAPTGLTTSVIPAELSVAQLVEDGELTEFGHDYVYMIEAGFAADADTMQRITGKKDPFQREIFIRELLRLPPAQQIVLTIDQIDGEQLRQHTELRYWYSALLGTFPLSPMLACNASTDTTTHAQASTRQSDIPDWSSWCWPSFGVSHAFRSMFAALPDDKTIMHPVSCLGTVGEERLRSLHKAGFHPVLDYDPGSSSNHLLPHGLQSGIVFGRLHDTDHHPWRATAFSPSLRHLRLDYLPECSKAAYAAIQDDPALQPQAEQLHLALFVKSVDLDMVTYTEHHLEQMIASHMVGDYKLATPDAIAKTKKGNRPEGNFATGLYYAHLLDALQAKALPPPYGYDNKAMQQRLNRVLIQYCPAALSTDSPALPAAFSKHWRMLAGHLHFQHLDMILATLAGEVICTPAALPFAKKILAPMLGFEAQRVAEMRAAQAEQAARPRAASEAKINVHDCRPLWRAMISSFNSLADKQDPSPTLISEMMAPETLKKMVMSYGAGTTSALGMVRYNVTLEKNGKTVVYSRPNDPARVVLKLDRDGHYLGYEGNTHLMHILMERDELSIPLDRPEKS